LKLRQHLRRNRLRQILSAGHRRRVATAHKVVIVAASVAAVVAVIEAIVTVVDAVVRGDKVRVTKHNARVVKPPVKCATKAVKKSRAATTSVVPITATSSHANRANPVSLASRVAARRARVRTQTLRLSPLLSLLWLSTIRT